MAGAEAWTHRVPESTPTISASDASRRVKCPADGSSSSTRPGGHTERYSPPGPNLHSGSIRLIRYISIPGTLNSISFFPRWSDRRSPYRPPPTKNPNKNRTNFTSRASFLRRPTHPDYHMSLYGTDSTKMCVRPNRTVLRREQSRSPGEDLPWFNLIRQSGSTVTSEQVKGGVFRQSSGRRYGPSRVTRMSSATQCERTDVTNSFTTSRSGVSTAGREEAARAFAK